MGNFCVIFTCFWAIICPALNNIQILLIEQNFAILNFEKNGFGSGFMISFWYFFFFVLFLKLTLILSLNEPNKELLYYQNVGNVSNKKPTSSNTTI